MTYQEVLEQARGAMGPYCKACPVCNGLACRNTVPGPGAKGIGTGFIRNYQKWQELCVNMDTICENKPVDTSFTLFGRTVDLPVFAAPVGAMTLHYGDKYNDLAYNDILVAACAEAGIAAFTGDGTDPAVMEGAAAAIAKNGGCGVPTVKPWNLETIRQKMDLVKAADPFAIAMDIDAAGLPFLKNMTPPAGSKTVEELREIVAMAEKPFIVKGIMTVAGQIHADGLPPGVRRRGGKERSLRLASALAVEVEDPLPAGPPPAEGRHPAQGKRLRPHLKTRTGRRSRRPPGPGPPSDTRRPCGSPPSAAPGPGWLPCCN